MNGETFRGLKRGDLVRHKSESRTFVVTANYGDRVTATTTVDMTNPGEWLQVNASGEVIERQAKA